MQTTLTTPRAVGGTVSRRAQDGLRLGALLGALVLLGAAGNALAPAVRSSQRNGTELNGAGWEGRRLAAQLLWVKSHSVLHAGAEEREARPGEEKSRAGELHADEGHKGHAHGPGEACGGHGNKQAAAVLVIPPAKVDFRGVLGDLERAVKPYAAKDGKLYSKDQDQTLPFYRLVTWADPHYVQGYTVGATFICRAGKYVAPALEFLHEGERNNPKSFEIHTELGHFYLVYKKDYPRAAEHLLRAHALLPRDRKLTELEEPLMWDTYRWLALTYREWGKPEKAMYVAKAGLAVIKDDESLESILRHKGRKPLLMR